VNLGNGGDEKNGRNHGKADRAVDDTESLERVQLGLVWVCASDTAVLTAGIYTEDDGDLEKKSAIR